MGIKPCSAENSAALAEKYLGTQYDKFSALADALPVIQHVAGLIEDVAPAAETALEASAQTEQDAIATAADRVQTGLDRVKTTADRAQTTLDAATTTSDRVIVTALFDDFGNRYLGPKAVAPTVDNEGDPLVEGALYWNTTVKSLMAYNGTVWEDPVTEAALSADAANASALAAEISEDNADADATQTALDRIATGNDATATAADRVQTTADRAQTGADRTQTGLDAVSTAADRIAVANIFDQFDDRYLGTKNLDPVVDNDGFPLFAGQVYWNTVSSSLRFYNGATWEDPTAQAATSATAAHNSATAAALSETNADADATQTALDRVATAADRVKTTADALQTADDRVQTTADALATAADRVQTDLDSTQTIEDAAATAADRIQTGLDRDKTTADVVITTADAVKTGLDVIASEAAKDKAQEWASNAEDVEVEPGEYSAKHYSLKIGADALQTAADRVQTGLDVIATGEDKVQTGADVIAAGISADEAEADKLRARIWAENPEDVAVVPGSYSALHHAAKAADNVALTAADRVQTGLDVVATGADRTQTGLDVIATAADRVQTGLDKAQTGLDVTATADNKAQIGLYADATAADRIQTGLDADATAADRVQTGLDVTAIGDSVAKAEDWAVQTEGVEVEPGLYSARHYALLAASGSDITSHNQSTLAHTGVLVPEAPLGSTQYTRMNGAWSPIYMSTKVDKATGKSLVLDTEIAKIHTQNTDTSLDTGGTNPVTAAEIVTLKDITVPLIASDLLSHETNHPAPTVRDARNQIAGSYATAAQGDLADSALQSFTETDPVFTAWDKSTGISITESQISDLKSYLTSFTEADPVFTAWDKSTGISITESQISDFGTYLTSETSHANVLVDDDVIDEDTMASNSAVKIPTQQSVKAYVDASVAAGGISEAQANAIAFTNALIFG